MLLDCFTPSDSNGYCINLKRCPRLRILVETQRQNATVVAYLRSSFCGYEGKDVKVCCPLENEQTSTTEYVHTDRTTRGQTSNIGTRQPIVDSPKLPSINTCGKTNTSQNRIVGGHPADLG